MKFDIEKVIISGFKRIREPLTIDITHQLSILVGDNGVGKSTILEAIHLALTGMYRGEPIQRALSQALFNNDDVASFIAAACAGDFSRLPIIKIEVYLSGGDGHDAEYLSGAVNSEKSKHCGFTFSVLFDEDYRDELESLPESSLKSLPIEDISEIISIESLYLLYFVRCTEAVEEIDERYTAFYCRQVCHTGKVHNFLHRTFGKYSETSLTSCHYVLMVAKDTKSV